MSKKKPPVALRKLAYFLNNVHSQFTTPISHVVFVLPLHLKFGNEFASLQIFFQNGGAKIAHLVKVYDNSIHIKMDMVMVAEKLSNAQCHTYFGILDMYQTELNGKLIQERHLGEIMEHSNFFKMPIVVEFF